jgi:hypothetical protein
MASVCSGLPSHKSTIVKQLMSNGITNSILTWLIFSASLFYSSVWQLCLFSTLWSSGWALGCHLLKQTIGKSFMKFWHSMPSTIAEFWRESWDFPYKAFTKSLYNWSEAVERLRDVLRAKWSIVKKRYRWIKNNLRVAASVKVKLLPRDMAFNRGLVGVRSVYSRVWLNISYALISIY